VGGCRNAEVDLLYMNVVIRRFEATIAKSATLDDNVQLVKEIHERASRFQQANSLICTNPASLCDVGYEIGSREPPAVMSAPPGSPAGASIAYCRWEEVQRSPSTTMMLPGT
jgi:hypothetical protein